MNFTILLGRLTSDPKMRSTDKGMMIAAFTLAVDRGGQDKGADFISCKAFDKSAEIIETHYHKGDEMLLEGHIYTDRYEKDGQTIYRTDVIVSRVYFTHGKRQQQTAPMTTTEKVAECFAALDEDIDF